MFIYIYSYKFIYIDSYSYMCTHIARLQPLSLAYVAHSPFLSHSNFLAGCALLLTHFLNLSHSGSLACSLSPVRAFSFSLSPFLSLCHSLARSQPHIHPSSLFLLPFFLSLSLSLPQANKHTHAILFPPFLYPYLSLSFTSSLAL